MTIKLQTNELVRILKEAALFAQTAPDIPVINAVHMEARGRELIAIGTDRFTLGASKTELDEPGEFLAALSLRQVKTITQLAGSGKQCFSTVAVDADDKQVRVAFSSGETLTLPAEVERGPHTAWLKLLDSVPESGPSKAMDVNPQLLAKFARLQGSRASRMRLHFFGHTKPIKVSVGDSFVGLVMPIRMPDEVSMDWATPEWLREPEKPAPKPARKPRAKKPATKRTPAKASA
ncbi:DNA polymerase III sliding clamp [Mycobacterium phage Tortellini]|uniref:DNA polymerase III sliding clamp n=1 Tax=Mycobacterium phage Tortellini TaxID=1897497 RepID=A0A1D8EX60_9CAUD|nr:RusA-like Holliday junction resolvase [Mycobacterium phage Tortellini]AOT25802.1 DNA polymerase III sliding clamp [Mycobacterium phage Tortellini]